MKKIFNYILACFLIINSIFIIKFSKLNSIPANSNNNYNISMKQDLLCLMIAYPEYINDIEVDNNGYVYILMDSGRKILYDDKKIKSFEEKLTNADLQDTLEQIYPLSTISELMAKNCDPGRFRCYPLLEEVYGSSKKNIEHNLVNVNLKYKNVLFNNNNKAAESLKSAMQNLIPLSERNQIVKSCLFPCSGTFNYRLVAGTNRLSPHSFGIAIDLARDKRDYWRWCSAEEGEKRLNSYSKELVEIFENNNFIWGGKWDHFDILHFEYRPEIILKSKYFSNSKANELEWYEGLDLQDASIKKYIEKINQLMK